MRFLVMVKMAKEWDGESPTAEMGAFNDTLERDGIMLAAEGLQPSSKGARIRCSSPKTLRSSSDCRFSPSPFDDPDEGVSPALI